MQHRWAVLMSGCLVACATTQRGSAGLSNNKTEGGFPTREAIAEVQKLDTKLEAGIVADVEQWDYAGPFPAEYSNAIYNDPEPWTQHLLQLYKSTQGAARPTVAMNCVSRELARFALEHKKSPALSLQRDLAGRCKSIRTSFSFRTLSFKVPESMTDEALWKQAEGGVRDLLKVGSNPTATGLSYYRDGDQAVFLFASSPRRVAVNSVKRTEGGYIVEGEYLVPIGSMRSLTTVGEFGAAECVGVVNVQRPRFAVECPVAMDDDATWIEFAVFEPGAVFGMVGAAIRVHPSGAEAAPYRRPEAGRDAVATNGAELSSRLIELVNEVRSGAGHEPLVVDAAQSREAEGLAVPFFASLLGRIDPEVAETVALGMRAGWNVKETVRYGQVASALSVGVPNLSSLLANMLDGPYGRLVLLDPEARRIAIGPMFEATSSLYGTVIATYALFDMPVETIREQAIDSISGARSSAGRKPAELLEGFDEAVAAADKALLDGATPDAALQGLMKAVAKDSKTGAGGYYVETSDIDLIVWPKELVLTDARVVVSVGHRDSADEPWGRYAVLVAYERVDATTTAALTR